MLIMSLNLKSQSYALLAAGFSLLALEPSSRGQTFFASSPALPPGLIQTYLNLYCVATNDVNGDGRPDLITANYSDNSVTVLTNAGKGAFVFSAIYAVGSQPAYVLSADLNGDHHPDILTVNIGDNTLSVLTNSGNGTFGLSSVIPVGASPFNAALVNASSSAVMDLVCANNGDDTLFTLTNNGKGVFAISATNIVGNAPTVTSADLNGDGWLDLVTANYSDNTITILTNNAQGSFIVTQTIPVGNSPENVAVADLNGDGRPDLAVADYADNNVIILTNNGNGTFTASTTNAVGDNPFWVSVGDVSRDGYPDIVTANYGDGTLTVLTNNGNGTFNQSQVIPVGFPAPSVNHPQFVLAADLNGDGATDLVSANFGNGIGNALQTPGSLTVLLDLPVLNLKSLTAASVLVSWANDWPGYALQQSTNLAGGLWTNVNNPTGTNQVVISPTIRSQLFRLRHP